MYLVTGLGNPGSQYKKTRHNAGFMLVDRMAEQAGQSFERILARSLTCSLDVAGDVIVLAKPQTYMNLSGEAVREFCRHYSLDLNRLLMVYDEVALPLGTIRIRPSGSAGGHNGMESILGALQSEEVPRLRIGVSRGESPPDYTEFVLSNFSGSEMKVLDEVLDRAIEAIHVFTKEGIDRAMALYNRVT